MFNRQILEIAKLHAPEIFIGTCFAAIIGWLLVSPNAVFVGLILTGLIYMLRQHFMPKSMLDKINQSPQNMMLFLSIGAFAIFIPLPVILIFGVTPLVVAISSGIGTAFGGMGFILWRKSSR